MLPARSRHPIPFLVGGDLRRLPLPDCTLFELLSANETLLPIRRLASVRCAKTRRHKRRSSRRTSQGCSYWIAGRSNAETATCCLWCGRSAYVWMFQMPLVPELLLAAHDYAAIEDAFVGQEMGVKRQGDSHGSPLFDPAEFLRCSAFRRAVSRRLRTPLTACRGSSRREHQE